MTLANGKPMKFPQDKLSAADIYFLKDNGKSDKPAGGKKGPGIVKSGMRQEPQATPVIEYCGCL